MVNALKIGKKINKFATVIKLALQEKTAIQVITNFFSIEYDFLKLFSSIIFKVSTGYMFEKSAISFEYKSPLFWLEDYLVFGIQTLSSDALLFKAQSQNSNKTILIELVNGYIQAKLTDNNGLSNLHVFEKYKVNDNKYHEIKLSALDSNSSLRIDGVSVEKQTFKEKREF